MTDLQKFLSSIVPNGGYITSANIDELARLDRLRQVLIRCNGCRLVVAAQHVKHVIEMIDKADIDWVRDVALLSSDMAFRGDYRSVTNAVVGNAPLVA